MYLEFSVTGELSSSVRLDSRRARMSNSFGQSPDAGLPHAGDLALVQRALARDPRAVEALVARLACVPALLRVAHRRLSSPLGVDDLLEVDRDALAALWSKLAKYEGRASLETWAFRFVQVELHKALDRRNRQRRVALPGDELLRDVAQPALPDAEFSVTFLHACIDKLGEPTSGIVRLRHFEEIGFEELSRRLNLPLGTIKARYYRGLERLKHLLEPHRRRMG